MRKFILLILVLLTISTTCSAEDVLLDITNKHYDKSKPYEGTIPVDRNEFLYGKYPEIGADNATPYYLDISSCTYWINGGVATVSCIVYGTGRGANLDGTPAKVYTMNYKFDTYKSKEGRKIILKSVIGKNGENIAQHSFKWDNGFLLHLFWQAAKYSELEKDLD